MRWKGWCACAWRLAACMRMMVRSCSWRLCCGAGQDYNLHSHLQRAAAHVARRAEAELFHGLGRARASPAPADAPANLQAHKLVHDTPQMMDITRADCCYSRRRRGVNTRSQAVILGAKRLRQPGCALRHAVGLRDHRRFRWRVHTLSWVEVLGLARPAPAGGPTWKIRPTDFCSGGPWAPHMAPEHGPCMVRRRTQVFHRAPRIDF